MKSYPLIQRGPGFLHNGRLLSTKAAQVPPVAARFAHINAGVKVKTLLSAVDAAAAQVPAGTPISFDALDAAEIMGVTPAEATQVVNSMKSAGLLVERVDGTLGHKLGYVLSGEARRT